MLDQLKQRYAELVQSEKQRWADLGSIVGAKEEVERFIKLIEESGVEGVENAPLLPADPTKKGSKEHGEEQTQK